MKWIKDHKWAVAALLAVGAFADYMGWIPTGAWVKIIDLLGLGAAPVTP